MFLAGSPMKHHLYKVFNIIAILMLSTCISAKPAKTVTKEVFIQTLINHSSNFATLICESIYAGKQISTYLQQSHTRPRDCYALLLPIAQRNILKLTKNLPARLTERQRNRVREQITDKTTSAYLHAHVAVPHSLYLEDYISSYPKLFCKGLQANKPLKLFLRHLTDQQCMAKVAPLIDACTRKYQSKIPTTANLDDIDHMNHLISSCVGIKFIDIYLDKRNL
jgi:hypothetical protein